MSLQGARQRSDAEPTLLIHKLCTSASTTTNLGTTAGVALHHTVDGDPYAERQAPPHPSPATCPIFPLSFELASLQRIGPKLFHNVSPENACCFISSCQLPTVRFFGSVSRYVSKGVLGPIVVVEQGTRDSERLVTMVVSLY